MIVVYLNSFLTIGLQPSIEFHSGLWSIYFWNYGRWNFPTLVAPSYISSKTPIKPKSWKCVLGSETQRLPGRSLQRTPFNCLINTLLPLSRARNSGRRDSSDIGLSHWPIIQKQNLNTLIFMTVKDTCSLSPHLKGIPSWCQHTSLQLVNVLAIPLNILNLWLYVP